MCDLCREPWDSKKDYVVSNILAKLSQFDGVVYLYLEDLTDGNIVEHRVYFCPICGKKLQGVINA